MTKELKMNNAAIKPTALSTLMALSLSTSVATAQEFEFSGKLGLEQRIFTDEGALEVQLETSQTSVIAEPELYWGWDNSSLTFKPFVRYDNEDSERTHADIRELSYIYASDDWELRTGIRKEYWGVTEFQHLVDVINQTDGVDSFDGEEKLGQLMLNLSMVKDWGIVDLYILPGFRERTFAGENGRLRAPYVIDTDNVTYESSDEEQHVDFAARWSHSIGDMELGLAWFHGTNREPILTPNVNNKGELVLQQFYSQMDQVSFDMQVIVEDWLWKFETIHRETEFDSFTAAQAGFEVSSYGVFDSDADLGWLMEYGWDSRGEGSLTEPTGMFQNDVFVGTRLAFNDVQSTELLAGFGYDLDHESTSFLIEGNRRLGDSFSASLDLRLFSSDSALDPLSAIEQDDHVQFTLEWFY